MNKIAYTFLLLLFTTSFLQAQHVGIGTYLPEAKLQAGDEISVSFLHQYVTVNLLSHPDEVFFNGHLITQL